MRAVGVAVVGFLWCASGCSLILASDDSPGESELDCEQASPTTCSPDAPFGCVRAIELADADELSDFYSPSIFVDGNTVNLVFETFDSEFGTRALYISELLGSDPSTTEWLCDTNGCFDLEQDTQEVDVTAPRFSSSGDLYATSLVYGEGPGALESNVVVAPSGNLTMFFDEPDLSTNGLDDTPFVTSSEAIVARREDNDAPLKLSDCSLDGSECNPVTDPSDTVDEFSPWLTPNGSRLYFLRGNARGVAEGELFFIDELSSTAERTPVIVEGVPLMNSAFLSRNECQLFASTPDGEMLRARRLQ